MKIVEYLIPVALFLPLVVGAKWRQRLQRQMAARYGRGQRVFISCLGYLGMIAFAAALGPFGFYERLGFQVPVFIFLMSSANWLFGTILFGAVRFVPKN